ncbi:hypothetical protein ACRRTK_007667 [Alexandromys fortis]
MKLSSSSVMCLPLFSGLRNSSISFPKPHTQPVLISGELQICARYWHKNCGVFVFLPFPSSPCFKFCVKSWRNCRENVRCLLGTGGVEVGGTSSCHRPVSLASVGLWVLPTAAALAMPWGSPPVSTPP